jgi:shikimate kinase
MRFYLTGFMGAGKSRVGGRVAKILGCPLLDLDREIEKRARKSVREIFATQGESRFRDLEHNFL